MNRLQVSREEGEDPGPNGQAARCPADWPLTPRRRELNSHCISCLAQKKKWPPVQLFLAIVLSTQLSRFLIIFCIAYCVVSQILLMKCLSGACNYFYKDVYRIFYESTRAFYRSGSQTVSVDSWGASLLKHFAKLKNVFLTIHTSIKILERNKC